MILEFSVKNYLSYKDEMTLSFEPTKDKTLEKYFCYPIDEKDKVLKLAVLIGQNASGKSNILKAINYMRKLAITPRKLEDETGFKPFAFDSKTREQAGEFEIYFYKNQIKYNYYIKLNKSEIVEEYLYYYPKRQPVEVFTRKKENINFGSHKNVRLIKKYRDALDSNTIKSMSVLSALQITKVKAPILYEAFYWFKNNLLALIKQNTDLKLLTTELIDKDEVSRKMVVGFLKRADFNIESIDIRKEPLEMNENFKNAISNNFKITSEMKENILQNGQLESVKLFMQHKTVLDDKKVFTTLDFKDESDGTQRFFELGGPLSLLLKGKHILSIDDVDRSLHPDLVKYFINSFLMNSSDSQLIVTSHNLEIIADSDSIRRDTIWFTEKQRDGSTDLFSLSDFDSKKIRKGMNYLKAYKAGKFGAIPNLGSMLINMESFDEQEKKK